MHSKSFLPLEICLLLHLRSSSAAICTSYTTRLLFSAFANWRIFLTCPAYPLFSSATVVFTVIFFTSGLLGSCSFSYESCSGQWFSLSHKKSGPLIHRDFGRKCLAFRPRVPSSPGWMQPLHIATATAKCNLLSAALCLLHKHEIFGTRC